MTLPFANISPSVPSAPAPVAAPAAVAVSRTFLGKWASVFLASLTVCVLAYLAWALPGTWFSSASVKIWAPQAITLVRGTRLGADAAQAHFAPDASGLAVLAITDRFAARDYPVLDWNITNLPEGTVARLLWRNDYAPNAQNQIDLSVENGRLLPATTAQNSAWLGNILGIALAIQLPAPQPFTVTNLRAHPMDAIEMLTLRIKEWGSFPGWRGTFIFALEDPGTIPLSLLVAATLALPLLFACAVFLWRRWRDRYLDIPAMFPRSWLYGGMVLFCMGWMLLDLRWTIQLAQQASQTWSTYGNKDMTQKHLAAEDGALFAFIEKVQKVLPSTPVRLFALAEMPYLRSRIAYHLYPNNVFYDLNSAQPPDPRFLKPGDFLLVFQQRGIQYDVAKKKIRLPSGAEFNVDAKLIDAGSALFEIQ